MYIRTRSLRAEIILSQRVIFRKYICPKHMPPGSFMQNDINISNFHDHERIVKFNILEKIDLFV